MNVIHHRMSYKRKLALILSNNDYEQSNTKLAKEFAEQIQENDLILFYYSSCVYQMNEKCYLIPIQNQHLTNEETIPDLATHLQTIFRHLFKEKKQLFVSTFILDCPKTYSTNLY
ncbi:unnamed protein product [Adineta ricciae]|uniref:Uncharacterized protein n=1 Tax=Adineta ricciae TaxID=249248 RepID=A0A815WNA8_ADIRI|nr:unnamed protein product [Adineta ricciae]CAF1668565.1 unnamed protein product [Adineta ricciae]